jgi:hypothetical protein
MSRVLTFETVRTIEPPNLHLNKEDQNRHAAQPYPDVDCISPPDKPKSARKPSTPSWTR